MLDINLIFVQIFLSLIIGMWIGVVFKDSVPMRYIERNNWVIGLIIALIGFINFIIYEITYLRNVNLVLVIVGLLIISLFLIGKIKK